MTDDIMSRLHIITCMAQAQAQELTARLRAEGVVVYALDGSTVRDAVSFLAAARTCLPLDPPSPNDTPNWDAFSDSLFGGIALEQEATATTSFVVIWTQVQNILQSGLEDLVRVVSVFEQVSHQLNSAAHGDSRGSLNLILAGDGPNFPDHSCLPTAGK
jgi:hypothetical protein